MQANDAGELDYDIKTRREPIWLEAVGTVILGHARDWHRYVRKNESDLEFEVRKMGSSGYVVRETGAHD